MRDSPKLSRRARAPFRNLAQAILAAQIDKADAVRLLDEAVAVSNVGGSAVDPAIAIRYAWRR